MTSTTDNPATPTRSADEWLAQTLSADTVLASLAPGGVFGRGHTAQTVRRLAPAFPAIVFGLAPGGRESYTVDGEFGFGEYRYDVTAIDKSESPAGAMAAAARVHELISNRPGIVQGGLTVRCQRMRVIDRSETAQGGVQFQHVGGTYRVWIV